MSPELRQSWAVVCTPESRGHPLHPLCGCRAGDISDITLVRDRRGTRWVCSMFQGTNKHGGNRDMHQRTGRIAFPAAHVGWDGPGDKHIVTLSSINPTRLCLHNRECFSCFMEVDRNNTGTNEARARLSNTCPAPALVSQPIKAFYFKRDTDFIAQFRSSTFHPGTNRAGKAAPRGRLPACH